MGNEIQSKTLHEVLELEKHLISLNNQLARLESEVFPQPPSPPVKANIVRTYPEIKSNVKFNKALAIIPSLFFLPWIAIYYFVIYKKQKAEDIEAIRNSDAYKNECARLDASYAAQEVEATNQYELLKAEYDNVTIPNYNNERAAWNAKHDEDISNTQNDISLTENRLATVYSETKIVPVQYRNVEALDYIYSMVSTSDYDVAYAINSYDTHRQRMIDTERLRVEEANLQEQQIANALAEENASLLEEQNRIAERARRDANRSAAVAAVQRHNTNKYLKGK